MFFKKKNQEDVKGELQISDNVNSTIAEAHTFGSWKLDIKNDKIEWSDGALSVLGIAKHKKNKEIRDAFYKIVHPEDAEKVKKSLVDCIENKSPYQCKYRIIKTSGSIHFINAYGDIILDDLGEINFILGTIVDVTELKKVEDAKGLMEMRLLETQRIAHIGSVNMNYQSGELIWSDEMYNICKLDKSVPITYEKYKQIIHPDDFDEVMKCGRLAKKNKAPYNPDYRIIRPDGEIRHVSAMGIPTFDENGVAIRMDGVICDITDKVLAEKDTEKIKTRLLEAQRIARVGNWEHNLIDDSLHWSDEYFRICGLQPQECVPSREKFKEIIHPDDYDKRMELFEKTLISKETFQIEYRIIRPNGEIRHIKSEAEYIFDEDQEPLALQGTFHDITEQTLSNMEANKLETRLLEAQRISHIGSWNFDLVTENLFWSDEIFRIIGFEVGSIKPSYKDFIDCLHPDDKDYVENSVDKAIKNNKKYNIEHRIIRKDGQTRIINAQGEVTFDENDVPVSIDGTMHDITDRKNAEIITQENEQKLREVQSIANLGYWTMDLNDKTLVLSDEIYKICGLDRKTYQPTIDNFDALIPPEDLALIKKVSDDAKKGSGLFEIEHRMIRPDGEERDVHVRAKISFDENRVPISIDATMIDITERKKIESEINLLDARLLEAQRIAHMGNWAVDYQKEEIYWSDEIYRICGLEPQSIEPSMELFYQKIAHPDDAEMVRLAAINTKENDEDLDIEFRIIRPTGEIRYLNCIGEVTLNNEGEAQKLHGVFQDITRQKLTEDKLKSSQRSLVEAQRIAHFGSWNWNIENNSIDGSEETSYMLGLSSDHKLENMEDLMDLIHKDDKQYSIDVFKKALKSNKNTYSLDVRIVKPDGDIRSVFLQAEIRRNNDGWATNVLGTILDITERKRAEEAAIISEGRMLEAQRIGGLGDWVWDLDDNSVYWSDQIYRIYGFDKNKVEPSYNNFRRILHPDDADKLDEITKKAISGKRPFQIEHRLILENGDVRTIIQRAEVITDNEGDAIQLNGTIQDITELKKAEEVAKKSEARLSEIFNIAPAAIITTDHQMNITLFNKSAVEIFGYEKEEIIGKSINLLIPDEYRHTHDYKIDEFNQSGIRASNMNERAGISGQKKNGEVFPAAASVSSIGAGKDKAYTVILLDSTERKIIEEERVLALTQAQNADKAKSQFLATMSHELRTPLNAIIGFSEMMTNKVFGQLGSHKYSEYAGDIVGSSRHLLNLVNDILDLSEIESGKKNMSIRHISLKDTIDDCRFIIIKLADDKNIKCIFEIPGDITLIYADQRALKQIIINLMTNSVKFTPAGGNIKLKAEIVKDKHIITIEDNGEGIPEDRIHDILNPFTRVENDPYKTHEGKGLGLAIVKSLMNLHHGKIAIESEYGSGTKVTLTFPNAIQN